jgi:hypothetical protein
LLQLVYAKGDVNQLIRQGLSYAQIANLIVDCIASDLITETNGALTLTEGALQLIRTDPTTGAQRKDGGWISPVEHRRVDKIPLESVYLPRKF